MRQAHELPDPQPPRALIGRLKMKYVTGLFTARRGAYSLPAKGPR